MKLRFWPQRKGDESAPKSPRERKPFWPRLSRKKSGQEASERPDASPKERKPFLSQWGRKRSGGKSPEVRQLWDEEFTVVQRGLAEDQVVSYVNELLTRNQELSQQQQSAPSLRAVSKKMVDEAEKEANSLVAKAKREAETEAARIIEAAEREAPSIVGRARRDGEAEAARIVSEANEQAEDMLSETRSKARNL